jgi:hypothetical protein
MPKSPAKIVYSPLAQGGDGDYGDTDAVAGPYSFSGTGQSPEATAGCCNRLFIHWLWPMLWLGRKRKLEMTDMYVGNIHLVVLLTVACTWFLCATLK